MTPEGAVALWFVLTCLAFWLIRTWEKRVARRDISRTHALRLLVPPRAAGPKNAQRRVS